jgi:GntR family transcriptional regulator / MocR family aminotransferase
MREANDQFSSTLYQAVMKDFIREGHFARHIRRMRMLYMERRNALVEAIQDQLGDKIQVIGEEAGMHLVALLPRGTSDVAVSKRAAEIGISAMPLSSCYSKRCVRPGLILGYGGTDVRQTKQSVRKLAMVI